MTLKKIKTLLERNENILARAIQVKRELHGRKDNPLFAEEYAAWGKLIDAANAKKFELEAAYECEMIAAGKNY